MKQVCVQVCVRRPWGDPEHLQGLYFPSGPGKPRDPPGAAVAMEQLSLALWGDLNQLQSHYDCFQSVVQFYLTKSRLISVFCLNTSTLQLLLLQPSLWRSCFLLRLFVVVTASCWSLSLVWLMVLKPDGFLSIQRISLHYESEGRQAVGLQPVLLTNHQNQSQVSELLLSSPGVFC